MALRRGQFIWNRPTGSRMIIVSTFMTSRCPPLFFHLYRCNRVANPSFHRTSRTKPRESDEFKRQAEEEQKEHL
jgi:hypothetical protein